MCPTIAVTSAAKSGTSLKTQKLAKSFMDVRDGLIVEILERCSFLRNSVAMAIEEQNQIIPTQQAEPDVA
jgi:hypothetical protein